MTRIPYTKPHLALDNQVKRLIDRGMICDDISAMKQDLSCFGYYRLSAYWYEFRILEERKRLDNFVEGAKWGAVISAYEFDRDLRLLVMSAIERIEVVIRTKIADHFSHEYGAFGYVGNENFHPKFEHHSVWLRRITKEMHNSKESFVQHFRKKYQENNLPIWMATQIMSLGGLSIFYSGMKDGDKKAIATFFKLPHKRLVNWLHVITYVRNICAHHSRLFNKGLSVRFSKVNETPWEYYKIDKVFYVLLVLKYLLSKIDNDTSWCCSMKKLFKNTDQNLLVGMGWSETRADIDF